MVWRIIKGRPVWVGIGTKIKHSGGHSGLDFKLDNTPETEKERRMRLYKEEQRQYPFIKGQTSRRWIKNRKTGQLIHRPSNYHPFW